MYFNLLSYVQKVLLRHKIMYANVYSQKLTDSHRFFSRKEAIN